MEKLPNLPIGRQYFASIRKDKAIYVDKTEYIYNICSPADSSYFLSRPRRFGKSLTLDTINELFSGNRALFEGLWIEDKWNWSETYPIIRMSLDAIGHEEGLKTALLTALQEIADDFELSLVAKSPGAGFKELIKKIVKKTGKQVVILIDEYDRPIVDYIDPYNLAMANKQRDVLKDFFSILKDASKNIRFLLITGVSKFARVSIFSDLNHLIDLTLNKKYAALCGYTQTELEHFFTPYLAVMPPETLEKMKLWYDGYSWDGATFVYNPFSVLNFFENQTYSNFWFATGTPTFLLKLMRKRFAYKLEETEVSNLILESFRLEKFDELDVNSLLLQTGYLTIKKIKTSGKFILDYPNKEVRQAFGQFLLSEYTHTPVTVPYGANILEALDQNNLSEVINIINNLIQSVPDQNYVKEEEKFFHAIIHLIFTMVGSDPRSEMHTPVGRMDTVIITIDRIFLFEFKIGGTANDAIQCIKDRNYAASLRFRNKPITGVGVVFSAATKGVAAWDKEEL
ncbi:MAG: AAA family ATPase [Saprospiraceae bacterium]|nr:AAA family ATPase [Saprospiraceae bacterium]